MPRSRVGFGHACGGMREREATRSATDRQIPIRVGFAREDLRDPSLVGQLQVRGNQGPVPLSAVADIARGSGPAVISRLGRARQVTFTAELGGRPLGDVMKEVDALPTLANLPPGVGIYSADWLRAFLTKHADTVTTVFLDIAGPHPMQAPPAELLKALDA